MLSAFFAFSLGTFFSSEFVGVRVFSDCCFSCLSLGTCASSCQAMTAHPHFAVLTHMCMNDRQLVVLWDASFHLAAERFGYWQLDCIWLETMTLFSGFGTDVHFSGEETGLQWEDYLFEMQNAVEWRMVMSRGPDERSQMHADEGARWILQGDKQGQREPDRRCQSSLQYVVVGWVTGTA